MGDFLGLVMVIIVLAIVGWLCRGNLDELVIFVLVLGVAAWIRWKDDNDDTHYRGG